MVFGRLWQGGYKRLFVHRNMLDTCVGPCSVQLFQTQALVNYIVGDGGTPEPMHLIERLVPTQKVRRFVPLLQTVAAGARYEPEDRARPLPAIHEPSIPICKLSLGVPHDSTRSFTATPRPGQVLASV